MSEASPPVPALAPSRRGPIRRLRDGIGLAVEVVVNPVLSKELRIASRQRRTYLLRAGYLSALLAVLLLVWSQGVGDTGLGRDDSADLPRRLQEQARVGELLSITLGWMQLVTIMLVAPLLTCTSISEEIENRSLDVLMLTPLSSFAIVVGKLASRLAHVIVLLLLGVPMLLGLRIFGGFDLQRLLLIEVLCLAVAIFAGSLGLLVSTWESRSWRTVMMTYLWIFLWWAVLPGTLIALGAWLDARNLLPLTDRLHPEIMAGIVLMLGNPLALMMVLAQPDAAMAGLPASLAPSMFVAAFTLLSLVVSLVLLALTVLVLRSRARSVRGPRSGRRRWWAWWRRSRDAVKGSPTDPAAVAAGRAVPHDWRGRLPVGRMGDNPILHREMRTRLFATKLQQRIAGGAIALLVVWFYWQGEPWESDTEHVHVTLMMSAFVLQVFAAAMNSTSAFTVEKQQRTWDTLLCTPLSPARILGGKVLGVLFRTGLPFAVLAVHMLLFAALTSLGWVDTAVSWATALGSIAIVAAFAVLGTAVGLVLSLRFGRSTFAAVTTLLLMLGTWLILPTVVAMLEAVAPSDTVEGWLGIVLLVNPFYWLAMLGQGVRTFDPPRMVDLEPWTTDVTLPELLGLALVVSIVVGGVGTALILAHARGFDRITGRAS